MTRYYLFPLLLAAMAAQTSDVTTSRWHGQGGRGRRRALNLSPVD